MTHDLINILFGSEMLFVYLNIWIRFLFCSEQINNYLDTCVFTLF